MSRILVIDDDPGTLETFGAILRIAGYDVGIAANGVDGLRLARDRACDLIVADLRLPDMTALELFRTLRSDGADTPFVIMTGFASVGSAVDAMKLGVRDYVEKPIKEDHLLKLALAVVPQRPPDQPSDRRVSEALQIIDDNYGDPRLRLRDVAHRVSTSVEHLCRLFKRETGKCFHEHLRLRRIAEATRLLQCTTISIKEIAYRCGFSTTTRMDRHFKICCGRKPSQLRPAPPSRP